MLVVAERAAGGAKGSANSSAMIVRRVVMMLLSYCQYVVDDRLGNVVAVSGLARAHTQAATDGERGVQLIYYAFDALHLDGQAGQTRKDHGRILGRSCLGTSRMTASSRTLAAWAKECPSRCLPICGGGWDPLARKTSPLSVPPPRSTRFGSPLVLSRVHWVEPKLVAEITYLTWTADNLLRHTVYVGPREDKPADQVRRER
jgi:ATP-dependent DNA ligase